MVVAFVFNRPYPAAPFSTLFLFGRGSGRRLPEGDRRQSAQAPSRPLLGAQPRSRARRPSGTPEFWLNIDRPPLDAPALWVGAGTKDTGISLTRFTFQITHRTDADADAERDFIVSELTSGRRDHERDVLHRPARACAADASTAMSPTAKSPRRAWPEARGARSSSCATRLSRCAG